MPKPITIICGATATGKSRLALELAQKSGAVIINADSQQMYREFRILTARPSAAEEACAPHKLYGMLSLNEPCSAGIWLRLAKMEIDWALAQQQPVIVCGGTGLYIKALTKGIAEIPDVPPETRAQAESDLAEMGGDAFKARLAVVDPILGEKLHANDPQRLIRAWAVWLATNRPLSAWQADTPTPPYAGLWQVQKVELPREELYARIDARVVQMVTEGAVEEVLAISPPPFRGGGREGGDVAHANTSMCSVTPSPTLPPQGGGSINKIIGLREFSAYLCGEIPLDAAIADTQQATRNYAKRQMT